MKVKRLIGKALSLALSLAVALSVVNISSGKAFAADTDEIMLGVFWTSDNDTTDTLYFSTDGENFYQLCEAFTDSTPNASDNYNTKVRSDYAYEETGTYMIIDGKDASGNPIYRKTGTASFQQDQTLHDPSIVYYEPLKCFLMISGTTSGTGADRRVVPMLSYSYDLENWNFASSGSTTNVKLSSLPSGVDTNEWDMVAPDFIVGDDGELYIAFSVGYFALFHGDDPTKDIMYPYICKVESIDNTMTFYDATEGKNVTIKPDPAAFPEAKLKVSYTDAWQVKLPCMESRSNVSHDHIDASFYKEDGYYYYVIKENGVTDEIWRTKDLSKTNDPSVWEEVCYDAVTGYEGPCLTKYQGQYFLYMDRLSSYEPTLLDDSQGSAFGSEGTWVAKASIGTTGALDGYTGWLETNIHEIKTWTDKDRSSTKANRHGTVITVSGEAAAKVRALAKAKGYPDSMLANTYSASSWDNTGWYYKESYRGDIGELKNSIVKYYYENDKRIGTSKDNSIGAERNLKIGDMAENPYYFKADSSDPELDGKMYCTNAATGYYGGEVEAKLPVDFAYYNEVGAEKYGNANTSWRWMRYDWQGIIRRCGNEDNNRLYQDGKTGKWYRYDPETGYMVKGAFGYQVPLENGDKEWRFMWFDLNSGEQLLGQGDYVEDYLNVYNSGNTSIRLGDVFTKLTVNRRDYYFDKYGTAWYEKYVYGGAPGVFGGPIASVVTTPGVLPVVEYHSPKLDAFDETGHPTEGNAWYKPDGENGKWYWYENGVRQGISADEKGVYGTDEETGRAINRGREICDNNILDANGNGTWFWLDSDANGARAVGKEVWVPYIFQDEGTWTLEQMKEVASESDPCMVNYVYECMALGSGKWVRYDENGHMLKGWVTIEGALADKYPDQVGNTYYYDTKTGLLAKGWINMDGAVYYFDSVTGVMKHDETLEINGVSYTFSSDGKCTNPPAV